VLVLNASRVLPRVDEVVDDLLHTDAVLHLRKDERAFATHPL